MDKASFSNLFKRYLNDDLAPHELAAFREAAGEKENQAYLNELLENTVETELPYHTQPYVNLQHIRHYLMTEVVKETATPTRRIYSIPSWFRYAAAVCIIVSIGAYFLLQNKEQESLLVDNNQLENILPGKEGAILTLEDGRQVVLDSLGDGVVAAQKGSQVLLQNGSIAYNATGVSTDEVAYNIMATPKGRQFQVTLPDGTKVWLNAASSLRYPTRFSGDDRRVEVTGEAYFEVFSDKKKPFFVHINNSVQVEVLGTVFNVNAYDNESNISTTLLEGSVRIAHAVPRTPLEKNASEHVILQPGQQAQFVLRKQQVQPGRLGSIQVINDVDVNQVMAWKDGLIYFDGMSFDAIMRQLERWYNIKVVYENNIIPNKRLAGKMTRGVSFHELLDYLSNVGLHYKFNERTLTILP